MEPKFYEACPEFLAPFPASFGLSHSRDIFMWPCLFYIGKILAIFYQISGSRFGPNMMVLGKTSITAESGMFENPPDF